MDATRAQELMPIMAAFAQGHVIEQAHMTSTGVDADLDWRQTKEPCWLDNWAYRIKAKEPDATWDKSDVPPLCWIRYRPNYSNDSDGQADMERLVLSVGNFGIRVATLYVDFPWLAIAFQYSIDRIHWARCVKGSIA